MPDVRLSADFKGHKAGEIVALDNAGVQAALDARAVAKVYPETQTLDEQPEVKPSRKK